MRSFCIEGGHTLSGEVTISGSKNAALALIPCSLLTKDKVVLRGVPRIKDIFQQIEILKKLNVDVKFVDHTLTIKSNKLIKCDLTFEEMKHFRASYYFYGALLWRLKDMKVVPPGGCKLGTRPIDLHLFALKEMGVNISFCDGIYEFKATETLNNYLRFPRISMGATINALLYAVSLNKTITIENYSKEPEVFEVIKMLQMMGAKISYNEDVILIDERHQLKGTTFNVIGDRIEAGTFILLGASLGKDLTIHHIEKKHLESLFDILDELNVDYQYEKETMRINKTKSIKPVTVETGPYPSFPSDLQPLLTSYLLTVPRIHLIKEMIYEDRFSHLAELEKCGAVIKRINHNIIINGDNELHHAKMEGKDLRATASLVFIALNINGISEVKGIEYFERGYEDFVEKILKLGGKMSIVGDDVK